MDDDTALKSSHVKSSQIDSSEEKKRKEGNKE